MSDGSFDKTFSVTDPARLSIANIRGSISITAGEAGVIEIKAIKHANFDGGKYEILMTQDSDGSVRVETHAREAVLGFLSHPPKVDYTARVPQGTHLDASGVSCSISVSGFNGNYKIKTVSGAIQLADLDGGIDINAVSGDISGSRLAGTLELVTVSGGVRISESSFPTVNASTVSGDINLKTPLSEGPYTFRSVSGSVRLQVPPDTHCSAELNTVSGSIRSSLPATSTRLGHGLKVTEIQGGGAKVRLKSVSGGLSIESEGVQASPLPVADSAPIPPASPSVKPSVPLTTAEILQRIESGEMSVDEALQLMKGQS